MSRSSLPGRSARFRRAVAVLALASLPFTMAACSEDEPLQGDIVEQEDGEGENGDDGDDEEDD